jgi:hypothetical protein
MKMVEIKTRAVNLGFDPGTMKKDQLIRSIQAKEGYESCFKNKTVHCEQYDCCWREDCKPK